jgi:hypothetical protein
MFFNAQKPDSNRANNEGQILLNAHLFLLKKTNREKHPDQYSKAFQELTTFLNHDERAPGPENPFLNQGTLRLFNELAREKKLPSLTSGLQPDNAPWHWGKGIGSLAIAAKLTESKKDTAAQLQKAGEELTRDPNLNQTKVQERFLAITTPYQELLEKFLPPAQREKQRKSLEHEGSELLTQKIQQLDELTQNLGATPEQRQQLQQGITAQDQKARRFANSEEYIQHVLGRYEDRLLTTKRIGKVVGDITIGTGVLFFAPSTVVPFIVAGYIGHRLSTMNVTARKDRKEQRLRDQGAKLDQNLDRLSVQQFGTFSQKLGAYLENIKLLPSFIVRKSSLDKAKTAIPAIP